MTSRWLMGLVSLGFAGLTLVIGAGAVIAETGTCGGTSSGNLGAPLGVAMNCTGFCTDDDECGPYSVVIGSTTSFSCACDPNGNAYSMVGGRLCQHNVNVTLEPADPPTHPNPYYVTTWDCAKVDCTLRCEDEVQLSGGAWTAHCNCRP